jgi:ribonuclease P protein component
MKKFPNEFGRSRKMTEGDDFKSTIIKGNKLNFSTFSLYCCPNNAGKARLGISVSRKVSKKAVIRNALKRIVRETFRTRAGQLKAVDCFFKVRPTKYVPNRLLFRHELIESFSKLGNTKPSRGK